jgi:FixJ family two-component response regulator
VTQLAERFRVNRPTIYIVLKRARLQEFTPRNSTNQRFKTLQLPVIVITGEDKEEIHEGAMNKGISVFLRKPVDGQVLLDAIEDAVGLRGIINAVRDLAIKRLGPGATQPERMEQ